MANPSFSKFVDFPKELRIMVWKYTISPQILTLKSAIHRFDNLHPPSYLYILVTDGTDGLSTFRHFTNDMPQRPEKPCYAALLEPQNLESPIGSRICSESRQVVMSEYKIWKMENHRGGFRNMMWNPKTDAILLQGNVDITDSPLPMFLEQFPEQAQEMTKLVLPASLWNEVPMWDVNFLVPLRNMESLTELIILINNDEESRMDVFNQDREWHIKLDVQNSYRKAKTRPRPDLLVNGRIVGESQLRNEDIRAVNSVQGIFPLAVHV